MPTKTTFRIGTLVTSAALGVVLCTTASAQIYFYNIDEPDDAGAPIGVSKGAAQRFITGPDSYTLHSITLKLSNAGDSPAVLTTRLFSDRNGYPGSSLTEFGTALLAASAPVDNVVFTNTGLTLDPNTTYYLVLSSSTDNSPQIRMTTSLVSSGPFTTANTCDPYGGQTSPNGRNWYNVYNRFLMVMSDGAVHAPEPSTFALALAGLGGLVIAFRRRRSRS